MIVLYPDDCQELVGVIKCGPRTKRSVDEKFRYGLHFPLDEVLIEKQRVFVSILAGYQPDRESTALVLQISRKDRIVETTDELFNIPGVWGILCSTASLHVASYLVVGKPECSLGITRKR